MISLKDEDKHRKVIGKLVIQGEIEAILKYISDQLDVGGFGY